MAEVAVCIAQGAWRRFKYFFCRAARILIMRRSVALESAGWRDASAAQVCRVIGAAMPVLGWQSGCAAYRSRLRA